MSADLLNWMADHALLLWLSGVGIVAMFIAGAGAGRSDGEGM